MSRRAALWLPLAAFFLLIAACSSGNGSPLPAQDVVSKVPWGTSETATYQVLQDNKVKGSGVLSISSSSGTYTLTQVYERSDGQTSDSAGAVVDASTLKPLSTSRQVNGPEGERDCRADYSGDSVVVVNSSKSDSRTDTLVLPDHFYDSAADLFLWRTIQLERGLKLAYQDVFTCNVLAKPSHTLATLEVLTEERVRVPAGTFDTWRVEMRAGGSTQRFWIAQDARRSLVRYDNGSQVFELQSISGS